MTAIFWHLKLNEYKFKAVDAFTEFTLEQVMSVIHYGCEINDTFRVTKILYKKKQTVSLTHKNLFFIFSVNGQN